MRDSNPRGVAANTLSKPVGRCSAGVGTVRDLRKPDRVLFGGRLCRAVNETVTETRAVLPSRHEPLPLLADRAEQQGLAAVGEREPWFAAFIDLLVEHGADRAVTGAAVDRLADLFTVTNVGWWEWAARHDPVLEQLGLCADQCSALVALLAGSRRYRHNGKQDNLLSAVRTAIDHGHPVELSTAQRRRLAVFAGAVQHPRGPVATTPELIAAEV
jgi:hypothetical protein